MKIWITPIIAFLAISIVSTTDAQSRYYCGTDDHQKRLEKEFPQLARNQQLSEERYVRFVQQRRQPSSYLRSSNGATFVIPVVVHIIHHPSAIHIGDSSNIPEQYVHDQIKILNEDYRRRPGTNGDGPGKDMQIEFQLARKDPAGNCHSGIIRIGHMQGVRLDDTLAAEVGKLTAVSHWPRDRYLNLYVIHSFAENVAGHSNRPWETGTPALDSLDGVIIAYRAFGYTLHPALNMGRTATHEIGHWLGLHHPFREGCFNDSCLKENDLVCDTPPSDSAAPRSLACNQAYENCHADEDDHTLDNPFRPVALGGLGDQPVQFQNYMDYAKDECQDRFTSGQYDRIRFFLLNQRASVVSSANLVLAGNKGLIHDFDSLGVTAGLNGPVTAMTEWLGKLVIGGHFTDAGGLPCKGLVTWNGVKYDTIPGTPDFSNVGNLITSMAVYQGDLYVGGSFNFPLIGQNLVRHNALYFGPVTTSFPNIQSTSHTVRALMTYKGKLYVGGDFGQVDGNTVNVNRVATWDGTIWKPLGSGSSNGVGGNSSAVYAFTQWNDKLIVGGRFSSAGGAACDKIAVWDKDTFTSLNTGTNTTSSGSLNALGAYDGKLFAGGNFGSVGGNLLSGLSFYDADSSKWKKAAGAGGVGSFNIYAIEPFNGYVWVGGLISDIGRNIYGAYTYDAATDSTRKVTAYHQGLNAEVYCMTLYKDQLFLGGLFTGLQGNTGVNNTVNNYVTTVKLVCPQPPTGMHPATVYRKSMKVYPIPASHAVQIVDAPEDVSVYDMHGRMVAALTVGGRTTQELNIAAWAAGVYLVRSGSETVKLVKN